MRKIYFLVMLFMLSTAIYANEDIISKIKEIDSHMYQGTIEFKEDSDIYGKKDTRTRKLIYDREGKYKSEENHGNEHFISFFDGKNCIRKLPQSVQLQKSTLTYNRDYHTINLISTCPNFRYGRGLSRLKNIQINSDNTLIGYLPNNNKIIAYLDPKFDYLAYKVERYTGKDTPFVVIENKDPILVDGKYYIYSNSFSYANIPVKKKKEDKFESRTKILSATFKEPKKEDYIFDWSNVNSDVFDMRIGSEDVLYEKSKLTKDITPDKLLEMTKKSVSEIRNTTAQNQQRDALKYRNKIVLIIISSIVIFFIIFAVVKKIKM